MFPACARRCSRKPGALAISSDPNVAAADIKTTIFGHAEFTDWSSQTQKFRHVASRGHAAACRHPAGRQAQGPESLAEELLSTFPEREAADALRHLPAPDGTTGPESMQDDVYLIASDGWRRRQAQAGMIEDKDKKSKDKPDFTRASRSSRPSLIPPALLIARYFGRRAGYRQVNQRPLRCRRSWKIYRGTRR